jgi:hypothetical protein
MATWMRPRVPFGARDDLRRRRVRVGDRLDALEWTVQLHRTAEHGVFGDGGPHVTSP